MKKLEFRPVTITYVRTMMFTPTAETFEDWDVEPTQEGFESYALDEFFDVIYNDVKASGTPMDYTNIQQLETVEIDWEDEE